MNEHQEDFVSEGNGKPKAMHINLTGSQIEDYKVVRRYTGITNDNDLVRYLLRQAAHKIRERKTGELELPEGERAAVR